MKKTISTGKFKNAVIMIFAVAAVGVLFLYLSFFRITGDLSFDRGSGFYDEPFRLKIRGGGRIFYTLDGTEPDENSTRYVFPLKITDASTNPNVYSMLEEVSPHLVPEFAEVPGVYNSKDYGYDVPQGNIDKATVVRAVRIDGDGNRSEVINAVYFVGMQEKSGYDNVGVISIMCEPELLFDEEDGIYMMGNKCIERVKELQKQPDADIDRNTFYDANYMQKGKKYKVPALVYFWDEDKNLRQIENCRIGIQGHAGRHFPKKSLNIYSDNGDTLEYCGYKFGSLNLFSGSQDNFTMMMDPVTNRLVEGLPVVTRHYTPYQVFLNGEYWGMYELTERFDESFFSNYYGIDEDDIVMFKRTRDVEVVELGKDEDIALYEEVENFAVTHDLSQKENFDALFEMIDYDSFLNYFAIQFYVGNEDWPNDNYALFRSRKTKAEGGEGYNDGKFRYIIFDMNMAARGYYDKDNLDNALNHDAIFNAAWQNEDFREAINDRMLFLANELFTPEKTDALIDEVKAAYSDNMIKEYARYYGTNVDIKDFRREYNKLKNYLYMRYRYINGTVDPIPR